MLIRWKLQDVERTSSSLTSGGKLQKHLGKGERSYCRIYGTQSPEFVGFFQANFIGCEFDMLQVCKRLAMSHTEMKHHFQVVVEMQWCPWLGLVVMRIPLDWRLGRCKSPTVTANFLP
ncbi:uncharacterized protein LOC115691533 [Syzygium oleosum]|uniref:uncharacterized protein LOC115691533 n=1 Tax=Syzygium oleosum TaxID=219896 RepID=UPI0024BB0B5F|nr:uncharacterized protein LOC115691533 [Syzygium oleosum]